MYELHSEINQAIDLLECPNKTSFLHKLIHCKTGFDDVLHNPHRQFDFELSYDIFSKISEATIDKQWDGHIYTHQQDMYAGFLRQKIKEGEDPDIRYGSLLNFGFYMAERLHLEGIEIAEQSCKDLLFVGVEAVKAANLVDIVRQSNYDALAKFSNIMKIKKYRKEIMPDYIDNEENVLNAFYSIAYTGIGLASVPFLGSISAYILNNSIKDGDLKLGLLGGGIGIITLATIPYTIRIARKTLKKLKNI